MSGRRKKDSGGGHGGEEAWLLPYADMITLLLGLFIVLFALSSIDSSKFDNVSKAFSQTFKGQVLQNPGSVLSGSQGALNAEATTARTRQAVIMQQAAAAAATNAKFDREQKKLESMAQQMQGALSGKVQVASDERGIVIRVAGDALFASGSYAVREPAISQLKTIAAQLKSFPGAPLEIEGHTDAQAFPGEFGNRGLSTDRANSVIDLFIDAGIDESRMTPLGKGATEPIKQPTHPNESIAKNRRVEIHILAPGKSESEFTPEEERITQLDARKRTVLESVQHDHLVKAARTGGGAAAAAAVVKKSVPSSSWGGTSKPAPSTGSSGGSDIIGPIVDASK
jgi:chemotaxis protein MotB